MTQAANKPIPTVPGLPVLGNLKELSGDVGAFLVQAYKEQGPVFRLTAPKTEIIVLAGVEANKFAAREGSNVWRNEEIWSSIDKQFEVERSILSLDGPEHREIRKVMRRTFGRGYLEENGAEALAVAEEDMAQLQPGQMLRVVPWCKALVMEQLSRVCVQTTSRPFLGDMQTFLNTVLLVTVNRSLPAAALHTPKFRWAKRNVFALADALLDHHRRNPHGHGRMPDLADDLLDAQKADPELWNENHIRAGLLTAFSAGLDTAASMLAFTLYRLHKHTDVLAEVRAEVDALYQDGPPTLETLGRAPKLHNAVLETLRLHPIAPALSRYVPQDFEFADYTIPAGSNLMIATTVPHFLPEVYRDPYKFDPERFGKERAEHRRAGVFHPFGVGSHTCLGSGMAEGLLLLNAAAIVHHLDLSLDPNFVLKVSPRPAPSPTSSLQLRVRGRRRG